MIAMMTIGTLGTRAPRRREADWIQLFVECCSRSGPRPALYVPNMRVTAVGKAVMIAMMTMGTLGTHAPRRRKAAKRHTTHGENFCSSLIQIRGKKTEIKKSALVLFFIWIECSCLFNASRHKSSYRSVPRRLPIIRINGSRLPSSTSNRRRQCQHHGVGT